MSPSLSLREIYGVPVVDSQGNELGKIDDVLFHPLLPFALGFSVKQPRLGGLIALKEKYLSFNYIRINKEGLIEVIGEQKKGAKAAWGEGATKSQGIDWEDSVIYYGQEVYTEKRKTLLGKLSDARFNVDTGEVTTVQVSESASSDLMQGKRSFSGALVKGFDLDELRLIVDESVAKIPYEGGAKEKLAEAGEKALESTIKGAATATVYAEKGIKAALETKTGKKASSFFRKMAADFKEALDDD